MFDISRLRRRRILKAAEGRILVPDIDNLLPIPAQYDACHREVVELHIRTLFQEALVKGIAEAEVKDLTIISILEVLPIDKADPLSVAGHDVVRLTLRCDHIVKKRILHLVRKHIVNTKRHILIRHAIDRDRNDVYASAVLVEHLRCI